MATEPAGNLITATESTTGVGPIKGLPGDLSSVLDLRLARVTSNIVDESSVGYSNASTLRGVKFEYLKDSNQGRISGGIAHSLFSFIANPPLLNEIVIIVPNASQRGSVEFFYISPLNLYNNGTYNPDVETFQLDANDNIPMGKGMSEDNLDKLRKLILAPGDFSLEGRFGNTIKMGNSNNLNIGGGDKDTPYKGAQNSPIIIIRNGQKDVGSSLGPVFEDINNDNSSLYLTKGQTISIDVASKNLKTFDVEVPEVTTSDDVFNFGELEPKEIDIADAAPYVAPPPPSPPPEDEIPPTPPPEEKIEPPVPEPITESDEVFVPFKSQPAIIEPPPDPPPSPPSGIPDNSEIYYTDLGALIKIETRGPKRAAVFYVYEEFHGHKEIFRTTETFSNQITNLDLAEEAAEQVWNEEKGVRTYHKIYGTTEPPPTDTVTPTPTPTPTGGSSPNSTLLSEYDTSDGVYKIYKSDIEYYADDPDGTQFAGGYSISSHDDSDAITILKEEIDDWLED
jgi:hypothetical protein